MFGENISAEVFPPIFYLPNILVADVASFIASRLNIIVLYTRLLAVSDDKH